MELTRRGFIAGAGAMASGMVGGAHAYSDRLRGSLRSGDTGDRAQPNAREKTSVASHDPNLLAFLSDIHLLDNTVRWNDGPVQSSVVLPQLVSEILALCPLPANAVVFGDFSASCGWEEDFRLAAACLKPLSDAGIVLSWQTDFYFNRLWQDRPRPKNWRERVKMHDGRTVTFWYDKPEDFYRN